MIRTVGDAEVRMPKIGDIVWLINSAEPAPPPLVAFVTRVARPRTINDAETQIDVVVLTPSGTASVGYLQSLSRGDVHIATVVHREEFDPAVGDHRGPFYWIWPGARRT